MNDFTIGFDPVAIRSNIVTTATMRNLKQQFDLVGFVIVRKAIMSAVMHLARHVLASLVDDPCDVVLFSNLMFHCSQPNRTSTIRYGCDWRRRYAIPQTLRPENEPLARDRAHPDRIVGDARPGLG